MAPDSTADNITQPETRIGNHVRTRLEDSAASPAAVRERPAASQNDQNGATFLPAAHTQYSEASEARAQQHAASLI